MKADVVLLPALLRPGQVEEATVVVFDVLRATTTMTAALHAGVREIRIFGELEAARAAAGAWAGERILCGERACLRPEGFDLGNSPGQFGPEHKGKTAFMCTTNGTRAIVAARQARRMLVGALVNAAAVAREVRRLGMDVVLLCAGTQGAFAMEDMLGAGAVLAALGEAELASDAARMAGRLFEAAKGDLSGALREAEGGRNVIGAGLEADIDFAARLDVYDVVGRVEGEPLRVVRSE